LDGSEQFVTIKIRDNHYLIKVMEWDNLIGQYHIVNLLFSDG